MKFTFNQLAKNVWFGWSISTNLLAYIKDWTHTVDHGLPVDVIYLDFAGFRWTEFPFTDCEAETVGNRRTSSTMDWSLLNGHIVFSGGKRLTEWFRTNYKVVPVRVWCWDRFCSLWTSATLTWNYSNLVWIAYHKRQIKHGDLVMGYKILHRRTSVDLNHLFVANNEKRVRCMLH